MVTVTMTRPVPVSAASAGGRRASGPGRPGPRACKALAPGRLRVERQAYAAASQLSHRLALPGPIQGLPGRPMPRWPRPARAAHGHCDDWSAAAVP